MAFDKEPSGFEKTVLSDLQGAWQNLRDTVVERAGQGVSDIGERLVAEVFQRGETLVDHPDMGRVVPEFEQSFLRELIHPPFRIVYRHDKNRVRIMRVWRSEHLLHILPDSKTS